MILVMLAVWCIRCQDIVIDDIATLRTDIQAQGECMADVYAFQTEQQDDLDDIIAKLDGLQKFTAEITAYTLDPQETDNDPSHAADMTSPVPGKTAAVSRDLATKLLGKKIYIPGYGVRVVNDLTAAGKENTIDILVGSKKTAQKVGKSVKSVVLL
jgi:3D (Asp-Asp-Asp) domain-containing protein